MTIFCHSMIYQNHSEKNLDVNTYEKFLVMERKLIKIIMTPSMVITWILGILLLLTNDYYILELWMQIKMLLVLLMSATHGYYVSCYKKFLLRKNNRDHKFFRVINEILGRNPDSNHSSSNSKARERCFSFRPGSTTSSLFLAACWLESCRYRPIHLT